MRPALSQQLRDAAAANNSGVSKHTMNEAAMTVDALTDALRTSRAALLVVSETARLPRPRETVSLIDTALSLAGVTLKKAVVK